mmetsp:Transcript_33082/g.72037  ORF Transcript_33082/g.72037 Transcript_33082/m.72037 type:complete len:686 (-) Transcript_33082:150-2207(-)
MSGQEARHCHRRAARHRWLSLLTVLSTVTLRLVLWSRSAQVEGPHGSPASSFVPGPGLKNPSLGGPEIRREFGSLAATAGRRARNQVSLSVLEASKEPPQETIVEEEFRKLVEDKSVEEVVIASWSGGAIRAQLRGESPNQVEVTEVSDMEDLRNFLLTANVSVHYPASDELSEEEAIEQAEYSSEAAVLGGVLTAAGVGAIDAALDIGLPIALSGGTGGLELEMQSLLEDKAPEAVLNEDLLLLGKDLRFLERVAERAEQVATQDFQAVQGFAAQEALNAGDFVRSTFASAGQWCHDVVQGITTNHAPGIGGIIEDSFMALVVAVSLFSLWEMAFLKRKSNSWSGTAHTATGAMQIGIVIYAIIEERCLRESPGAVWAVFTWLIFMVNNLTMWPLLKYFKGPEVQRVLFKLAYSFIISFQGIHAIAFSAQYPWLYWIVMPFWFYSVKKLAESSDNVLALLPDGFVPIPGLQDGARRRVKGIQQDVPTILYSALNFAGAVFDNLYMAVYTWRGPDGFWGWSAANIPGVNDHLRTALVKPAFASLTISVLVFLATLVYRRKVDKQFALVMNVILASVGPWLILYYHKLIDWDEPWQPEIMGDWGASPYFVNHFSDLGALAAMPLAFFGIKAMGANLLGVAPAAAVDVDGAGLPSIDLSMAGLSQVHDAAPDTATAAVRDGLPPFER